RCQVHKKRNVKAHVPDKHHAELERRLSEAYHETGYEAAKASLEATARWLERINSDAASSLREGLGETLAVGRRGAGGETRAGGAEGGRGGAVGDAPGHGAGDAVAGGGDAAAVVRGGPVARREPVPPGQGAQGPPEAHQGPGGIHPSMTLWNRARRRVRMAGG